MRQNNLLNFVMSFFKEKGILQGKKSIIGITGDFFKNLLYVLYSLKIQEIYLNKDSRKSRIPKNIHSSSLSCL